MRLAGKKNTTQHEADVLNIIHFIIIIMYSN